jgi:putative glutamine amidotransferase
VKKVVAVAGTDSAPYVEALRTAGVELIEGNTLCGFDGLVLMGGTDVNPARYGEARDPQTDEPDDARDDLECALIEEALVRDVPILGICRGLQILNVQHGGSLIQHVEGHRVRTPEDRGRPAHSVEIVPNTRLALIAGSKLKWEVNSRHHQAVARVGDGLIVSAKDPRDGIVEALERPDKRFVVAVQWHPENQSDMAKLFCAFAASL